MSDMHNTGRGKVCTRCGRFRNWGDYPAHKLTRDGKQSWCRFCKTEGMRNLRAERRRQGVTE